MSASRSKRQFAGAAADPSQRQITSFFSKSSSGAAAPDVPPLQGPVLPASVQANLLSVGMRVRKSVPEGYKTSSPSVFKLWTDPTPALGGVGIAGSWSTATAKPRHLPSAKELLPFCGINKVGGMDTQPAGIYEEEQEDDEDEEDVPGLDAVPDFTISQESAGSVVEVTLRRKRAFDEDEVQAPHGGVDGSDDEQETSARIIAVPRSRVKGADVAVHQETMIVDDDFEEAGFLVLGEARRMDTDM